MVQTQFGSIGQLIKGCCLTDRPVMLLLSMLVLLMSIQVILACRCEQIDWERVMRPEEITTVLVGEEIGNQTFEYAGCERSGILHEIWTERMLKVGPKTLFLTNESDYIKSFWMFTPHICSPFLKKKSLYVIYGIADDGGLLQANKCTVESFDHTGFFNMTGRENLFEILRDKYEDHGLLRG